MLSSTLFCLVGAPFIFGNFVVKIEWRSEFAVKRLFAVRMLFHTLFGFCSGRNGVVSRVLEMKIESISPVLRVSCRSQNRMTSPNR